MKNKQGISLIETVVALMILGVIGGALMGLTIQITSATNSAKAKSQAAIYAQEAIEQVKDVKNQSWANVGSGGCFADGTLVSFGNCSAGSPISGMPFNRYVRITVSGMQAKVQSVVLWKEKGVQKSVEVDTFLYQY